jgi:DDE superfamily endonuclease
VCYSPLVLLHVFADSIDVSVVMSQNGWTDDFIGAEWFEKSFIPQSTARNKSGKPILLVLDGHGSHETSEIIRLAELHNIVILCLPPHTTHKLQPLDVGVFGPFQRAWLDQCDCIV